MKFRVYMVLMVSGGASFLSGCASAPDHFHVLQPLPAMVSNTGQQFTAQVEVRLSVPSLVDRNQMVLGQGAGIQLLEHERWASPLVDQLTSVLSQDLEQQRPDLLISSSQLLSGEGNLARISLHVEVVALTLSPRRAVQLEVRWKMEPSAGAPRVGRDFFSSTPEGSSAASLAMALSHCVSALAERLAPVIGAG